MRIKTAILASAGPVLILASFLQAQQTEQLTADANSDSEAVYASTTFMPAISARPGAAEPTASPAPVPVPPQSGGPIARTKEDDTWHIAVSPYLWFPGVHGTLGTNNHDASFRASAGDLVSKLKFGLMGGAEARRNRLLIPIDLMWMRLEDNKAIPFPPELTAASANVKASVFILTPKVGVRLINGQKFTADFLTGIRYWYFGETVKFFPDATFNFSRSQSWVDPIVGGRLQAALAPKISVTVAGDVGGWGTGSQLEYQTLGLLGYKLNPAVTLQAGYRYLYFDYSKGGSANPFINTALSGVIFGATLNLK